MLRVWNVVLVALTFSLSLFGTFLTRSGVLSSIHSFARRRSDGGSSAASRGRALIAALMFGRFPLLRAARSSSGIVTREATFLFNNLLLVAMALTVLWGVVFPLISEAVHGERITVGQPYFDFFLRVFGIPLSHEHVREDEREEGQRDDAVHREERGVEPPQVAGPDERVLVAEQPATTATPIQ